MSFRLRPMQAEILPLLTGRKYYMLVWEMRSGKTLPAYLAAKEVTRRRALVVCPPNVMPDWMKTHALVGADDFADLLSSGMLKDPDYVDSIMHNNYDVVIVDEIHQYRHNSIRTRLMRKLTDKAEHVYGLTGTPFDKDLSELFYPWMLLDKGKAFGRNRSKFRRDHCYPLESGGWKLTTAGERRIREVTEPHMSVYAPKEIKAPDYTPVRFALTRQQSEFYVKLANREPMDFFEAENVEFPSNVITEKMFQLTSGFLLWTKEWVEGDELVQERRVLNEIPTIKWSILRQLVNGFEGRFVCWVRYIREYELILEACRLAGKRVEKYTTANLDKLRSGKLDGLAAHPRSAGVGVDISCADHAVFVSETPGAIDQAQARARLSFMGDSKTKTIHYLLAQEPKTEGQHDSVLEKTKRLKAFVQGGRR